MLASPSFPGRRRSERDLARYFDANETHASAALALLDLPLAALRLITVFTCADHEVLLGRAEILLVGSDFATYFKKANSAAIRPRDGSPPAGTGGRRTRIIARRLREDAPSARIIAF